MKLTIALFSSFLLIGCRSEFDAFGNDPGHAGPPFDNVGPPRDIEVVRQNWTAC